MRRIVAISSRKFLWQKMLHIDKRVNIFDSERIGAVAVDGS
jgi:hypothetical protein